ncbi:Transporter [hydrothermal vent metagenome]|uniref:Transporter n=1 Tax=hydrothermal vent metagenome TaxID=652676 RepID=A0A1W1CNH6_9ZZZZ
MFESFANWLVFDIFGLLTNSSIGSVVQFFIMDITKIFFMLMIIIYFMGLLRFYISPEKVRDYLQGKSKFVGQLMAIVLGAVTPFCSCSSIPLFLGFLRAGIPLRIVFTFLIASPMINEIAVIILIGIVGWKATLMFVASGSVIAFFGGILMEKMGVERHIFNYDEIKNAKLVTTSSMQNDKSWAVMHNYAIVEAKKIFSELWKWVIMGVGVGALFHGFFPQDWAQSLDGDNLLAVPMAVFAGVPLYSDEVGIIPLVEAMLLKGVAVGTTLAFMMSIAAISLPELLILKKVMHLKALALFTGIVAISIMLVGLLFNLVL